jgi:hypothetical protein
MEDAVIFVLQLAGGDVLPPIFRLGQVLQYLIAARQEATHVANKKYEIGHPTEKPER